MDNTDGYMEIELYLSRRIVKNVVGEEFLSPGILYSDSKRLDSSITACVYIYIHIGTCSLMLAFSLFWI